MKNALEDVVVILVNSKTITIGSNILKNQNNHLLKKYISYILTIYKRFIVFTIGTSCLTKTPELGWRRMTLDTVPAAEITQEATRGAFRKNANIFATTSCKMTKIKIIS
jgi:hypothetical protein